MSQLGVAGLQLTLEFHDNFASIEKELRKLKTRFPWVQLAVLSELAVHGIGISAAEPVGGLTERRFCSLARELGLWLVPGSFYQTTEAGVTNSTPIIDPDGNIIARYAKLFPFLPYEQGVTAGANYVVFDIPGVARVGISNCYDMWFPETIRTLAALGAEIVVHPSMTNTVDRDVELAIGRSNAALFQLYFLDVNGAGEQGLGRSALFGPGGDVVYQAGEGRDVMAFLLDLQEVRRVREQGWHGLGQTMKSFRDSEVEFSCHTLDGRRTPALDDLGPLEMPGERPTTPATVSVLIGKTTV